MKINNYRGTSLIEVMVATAILTIAILSMMYMVGYAFKEQKTLSNLSTQERLFQLVSTDLRGDPSMFQKNFTAASVANSTILADESLPFMFNDKIVCDNTAVKVTAGAARMPCCPTCPGRMGYTIRPINNNPGMYMASVRIVHPDISGGQALYDLIITPK